MYLTSIVISLECVYIWLKLKFLVPYWICHVYATNQLVNYTGMKFNLTSQQSAHSPDFDIYATESSLSKLSHV
jgi:hypothetical protein